MIISIFVHCFPPAKGGLEYLVGEVKKILDNKHQVHIITGQGLTLDSYKTFTDLTTDNSNNIHRLQVDRFKQRLANKFLNKIIFKIGHFSPFYFGPILKYSKKIEKIIANSDIIIGAGIPTKMFYDAYFYAKKYGKKLILIPAYHNVNYYNNCLFFQKAFDYTSKVLYLTPLEKNELQKNYHIDNKKLVQTTFCPFTKKQIEDQQKKLPAINKRHQNNFKNKKITLGFIGQITHRKNLAFFKDYLDKYLSYWQSRGYSLKVYLAGAKTNSSSQIEEIFKDYLNKKTITINYDFKPEDKEKEFSKIDIFINPSLEESLGIVNFEAIYYGSFLSINSTSAFSTLDKRLPTFINPINLHQKLTKNLKKTNSDYCLFNKYNRDMYATKLLNLL
jgi:glycosyltransferase involved in cell wall biosynthesis